jgi:ferritin-like metal-binding protein YciE
MQVLSLVRKKIEHYEIATYGTLSAFCKTLGKMMLQITDDAG